MKAPEGKPATRDVWMCGLFMLLFMIGIAVGVWLLNLLAIVQTARLLAAREPKHFIARLSNSLSIWLTEIGRFVSCATDDKAFPWLPRPDLGAALRVTASS